MSITFSLHSNNNFKIIDSQECLIIISFSDTLATAQILTSNHMNNFAIAAGDSDDFDDINRRCLLDGGITAASVEDDISTVTICCAAVCAFRFRGCFVNCCCDDGRVRCNSCWSRFLVDSGSMPILIDLVVGAVSRGDHSSGNLQLKYLVKKGY